MPRLPAPSQNPFLIGTHARGADFCNRTAEVATLTSAFLTPTTRLLVHGDRRLGKSSTLHEAARQAQEAGGQLATVDLGLAPSVADAARRILATYHAVVGQRWMDAIQSVVAKLRGAVSMKIGAEPSGTPTVSFEISPEMAPPSGAILITDILTAIAEDLATRRETFVLALDEFQRLGQWYGTDVAWQLKSVMERHPQLGFILAGSQSTLIEQMFSGKGQALWKGVEHLPFTPIAVDEMVAWLMRRSSDTGVPFSENVARRVCALAGTRTRDIVQVARATWGWGNATKAMSDESPDHAFEALVREQGAIYARYWEKLNPTGQRLLTVLAVEPDAELTSDKTRRTYQLGAKSTVHQALSALVEDETLMSRKKKYGFDDPFFRRWTQVNTAANLGLPVPPLTPMH